MNAWGVSENKRFLTQNGLAFFPLGDTAWEMLHRLTREETQFYLQTRAAQGFNWILTVALAEFDGLRVPNAYGDLPLHNLDPARPNEAYFAHVDFAIETADAHGLTVGLLPTWADKVGGGIGVGPQVFTPQNARAYGEFLGQRYKNAGLVWVLGGDRAVSSDVERAIWNAMAAGIKAGGATQLMTFHPKGGQSSQGAMGDATWLDFGLRQSGHCGLVENFRGIADDYNYVPTRPVLDGEPCYEDHPIMRPDWTPTGDWFGAHAVRRAAYWSVFSGACGHVYGCHPVWQFWDASREPINGARTPWRDALLLDGARQMRHVKDLLLSRSFGTHIPCQELVVEPGDGASHAAATKGDGFAFIYVPEARPVTINMNALEPKCWAASWFSPHTGTFAALGPVDTVNPMFAPPADEGGGPDWVLVLDAL